MTNSALQFAVVTDQRRTMKTNMKMQNRSALCRKWMLIGRALSFSALLLMAMLALVNANDFTFRMNLYNTNTISITRYTGSGGVVTIPNTVNGLPVTRIGEGAFEHLASLTSVTIPNSVTNIGGLAFYVCYGLTNVMIPDSVTSIGSEAFSCSSLAHVMIGNGDLSVGNGAFYNCTNLISVTIPSSVTNVGDCAFASCTSLTSVYFKGNAPTLGASVFDGDNNATIYYLAGTTGWSTNFGGRPTALWNP
jgi:hypothetical protein